MLLIKPNCEWCDIDLPPNATNAMICSYECTFCEHCVRSVFNNVCPNCGGGFCSRPIRPTNEYRTGVSLVKQPSSKERIHSKYSRNEVDSFIAPIKHTPPSKR